MRPALAALALLILAPAAAAQKDVLFGSGKPPVFREEETDRRFRRSKIGRALELRTQDPHCVRVLGGLLTALGEIGPNLHRRDEHFIIDPMLLQALNTQLTTPRFPATAYLATMVRRVLIDRRLPDTWLATAQELQAQVPTIDLGKLRFLNEGVRPIDSFTFTLPALRERFDLEVARATSAAKRDAEREFRDAYLDRDVAWGGLSLVDAGLNSRAPKGKGRKRATDEEAESSIAVLHWTPPGPPQHQLMVFVAKKPPPVKIIAKLAPRQFVDLARMPRGTRMLVRGRFWEFNRTASELEVREALLFEDPDWSKGASLGDPQSTLQCPLAINELTGTAPRQPGGFAH